MAALAPLLGGEQVLLDDFIESTFCWQVRELEAAGDLPYQRPWVGFVHNPPGIPAWHDFTSAPQQIFTLPSWRDSLGACRGLFTFSRNMADWLADHVPVPTVSLIHPTEIPERGFDLDQCLSSPMPRILQIGAWLRRLSSIALLPVQRLRKTCLIPRPDGAGYLRSLVEREQAHVLAARNADWSAVEVLQYLPREEFDHLLATSIVFLDLYDTVVNNTVIECIVRNTPILCNRLPGVVELLGEDYPLFYSSLDEAASKAEDARMVEAATRHLSLLPKHVFTGEHFLGSVAASGIYRSIASETTGRG